MQRIDSQLNQFFAPSLVHPVLALNTFPNANGAISIGSQRSMLVTCPTCKNDVEWDVNNPYRPFCCERCKLIDLGAWANEEFRIPAEDADPGEFPDADNEHDFPKH